MLADRTTPERENTTPPIKFLQVLWRRWWVIVLVAAVLTGSALVFTSMQTPSYKASIKILIGRESTELTPGAFSGEISGLQELTKTMAKAVTTVPVVEAAMKELDWRGGPYQVRQNLEAKQDPGTMFVNVDYSDSDPERAQLVANTDGRAFSEQVSEMSVTSNATITALVWQEARLPAAPESPDPLRNGLAGLGLGVLLGVGVAFLLESRDDRLNSAEKVQRVSGLPSFGVIPRF